MICENEVALQGCHGLTNVACSRIHPLFRDPVIEVKTRFGALLYVGTSKHDHTLDECNAIKEVRFAENSGLVLIIQLGDESIRLKSPDRNKYIRISHSSIGYQPKRIKVSTEANIQLQVPRFEHIYVLIGPCVIKENGLGSRIPTTRKVVKSVPNESELTLDSKPSWGAIMGKQNLDEDGTLVVIDSRGKHGIAIEFGSYVVFDENILFTNKPGSFYITVYMTVSGRMYWCVIKADKTHEVPQHSVSLTL